MDNYTHHMTQLILYRGPDTRSGRTTLFPSGFRIKPPPGTCHYTISTGDSTSPFRRTSSTGTCLSNVLLVHNQGRPLLTADTGTMDERPPFKILHTYELGRQHMYLFK